LSVTETLAPSVRWVDRPKLALVLIVSGLIAALAVGSLLFGITTLAINVVSERTRPLPTIALAAPLVGMVILEAFWMTTKRLRPVAVRTQVPQGWGHQHGPWKAALRYGPRLGVGPATLLNTWSWWGGAILSALLGLSSVVWFCVAFVITRSVLTVWVTGNPTDGIALASRMQRWQALNHPTRWAGAVALVAAALLVVAGTGR
jgi:hypothetical protein